MLTTRLGEHQTATDKEDFTNNIAQHHRKAGHDINWDAATCLTLGEHQTATDKEDFTNNIAQHHRKTGHDINWDAATCLTHSTDKDQLKFTNLQSNPLNRSRKLPAAYERLLQSEYRTADENAD